ncbi:hypothetical protein, partial [Burkholderia multivorans]
SSIFRKFSLSLLLYKNFLKTRKLFNRLKSGSLLLDVKEISSPQQGGAVGDGEHADWPGWPYGRILES